MHVAWRPSPIPDLFTNAGDAIGWQVFNRRASSATLSFGLFPAISASGAVGDSDQTVLPGLAFQPHLPAPFDIRAGTGVTVTRDAQGYTVAAPGAGTPPDSDQAILPGREFGSPFAPPMGLAGGGLKGTYPNPDVVAEAVALAIRSFFPKTANPVGASGGDLYGPYPLPTAAFRKLISQNELLPASTCRYISGPLELAPGVTFEVGAGAVLEIG